MQWNSYLRKLTFTVAKCMYVQFKYMKYVEGCVYDIALLGEQKSSVRDTYEVIDCLASIIKLSHLLCQNLI
jgi:hypothetical protein